MELHQQLLQLIRFGYIDHVINDPMHSVGGLIEDDKSEISADVCVVAPVCNEPLTF